MSSNNINGHRALNPRLNQIRKHQRETERSDAGLEPKRLQGGYTKNLLQRLAKKREVKQ